jgi:hypothetical protein
MAEWGMEEKETDASTNQRAIKINVDALEFVIGLLGQIILVRRR